MIIEVIGATSSGKSSLIGNLKKFSQKDILNINSSEAKPNLIKLLWLELRNWTFFLIFNQSRIRIINILILCLSRKDSFLMRVNLFRNFIKKYGEYEYIKRVYKKSIFLQDEGPIHAFSNLFCHYDTEPDINKLNNFKSILIFPDVILKVKTDHKKMLERAKSREDAPWNNLNDKQWQNIFLNTEKIYDFTLENSNSIPIIEVNLEEDSYYEILERIRKFF